MANIPDEVLSSLSDEDLAHVAKSKSLDDALVGLSDDALTKIAGYKPPKDDTGKMWAKTALEQAPLYGAMAGGAVGAPLGPFGMVAGAGLGSAMGKALETFGKQQFLGEKRTTKEQIVDPLMAGVEGATAQGAGEILTRLVPPVASGVKTGAKKAMTVFLGPKKEAIDYYLKRADAVRGAKSVEQIKNGIDDVMEGFFKNVDEAKLSREEAKAAYKEVEQRLALAASEAKTNYAIKGADIKDALRESKSKFESAFNIQKEGLSAIKSPIQLADDVQTSLGELKKKVTDLSKESYEILGKSNQPVNLQKPFRQLGAIRNDMMVAGQMPVTDEAIQAIGKIDQLIQRTGQLPVQLPASEAKKLVQQLDNAIDYGIRSGAYTTETQQALSSLRKGIDVELKSIPGYAEKMKEVSNAAGLLSKGSELFGTPQSAVSKLNQIGSRTAGESRQILKDLGRATGRDFVSPVDQFVKAQATLKDPGAMESIARGLPEFKDKRLQEMGLRQFQRPETKTAFIEKEIAGPLAQKQQAGERIQVAQDRLTKALNELEPFKRMTEGKTQGVVNNLLSTPARENIESRRALEQLSKLSGKDFLQQVNDLKVNRQFSGEYRNGSRNVVTFSALFSSVLPPVIGLPLGAAVGATIDRFGPSMAGKILDATLKVQGTPTVQSLQRLNLPPQVKGYLIQNMFGGQQTDPIQRRMQKLENGVQ